MPEATPAAGSYRWFAAGVASWSAAWGAQSVLFAWLVVGVLEADPSRVGTAQMATMLPSLLLLLLGGAAADRSDCRSLLLRLHGMAAALAAGLLLAVLAGALSYPLLIGYGLAVGAVNAFVFPARDSLLSDVAGSDLMRAVAGLTLAQWGSQAVGNLAGSAASLIGTSPALAIPALLFLLGVPALRRLPAALPPPQGHEAEPMAPRDTLREIREGLRIVAGSRVMRSVLLLVFAVGILFIGPFMVVLPILVRDVYGGGVGELGILSMTFPVGTIIGSIALLWRGGIRRKGRAQLIALAAGSAALFAISLGLPLAGTLVAICAWGISASIFMSAGRTLYQEAAPPTHRGRVLSVYTLGFMGSGPMGALLSGFLVQQLGVLAACATSAAAMLVVVLLATLGTQISRLR